MKKYERPINIPVAPTEKSDGIFDWLYVGMLRQNDTVMGTVKVTLVNPDKYDKELCVVSAIENGTKKTLLEFPMKKPDALKLNAGKTMMQIDGTIESIKRDPENPTDHSIILKDVKISGAAIDNRPAPKRLVPHSTGWEGHKKKD